MEHVFDQFVRACWIENYGGPLAEVVNLGEDTVKMDRRGSLRMHEEVIGARPDEVGEISLRLNDHKVHIERLLRATKHRFDDYRPDRHARHEATVHHVDMNPVCARPIDSLNLLGETSEIRRQD
jgi:hypothetical protein